MADSSVAVTAGSGTNIDTRTEATNGDHRQVVVVGDPSTTAGVAPVDGTAGLKVNLGADNDVTVTGTVDLGATDNAVLDAIASSVANLDGGLTVDLGSNNDVTVTGTVDLGATDNAVLDAIQAATEASQTALETLDNAIAGTEMQVDIVAPLPTGSNVIGDVNINGTPTVNLGATDNAVLDAIQVATEASQTALETSGGLVVNLGTNNDVTVTGTVDLGATDNAVLDAIQVATEASQTALETLDNAISGTEMQVDIVDSLPTGTNTIGAVTNDVLTDFGAGEYETVAANQSTQTIGATGSSGDFLCSVLVVPATTSPGSVQIKDGSDSAITVFTGGADSVATLHPFTIPLNLISGSGAWQVTTGSNVSVIATGNFT